MTKKKTNEELAQANFNTFINKKKTVKDAVEYICAMNFLALSSISSASSEDGKTLTIEQIMSDVADMTLKKFYWMEQNGMLKLKHIDGDGEVAHGAGESEKIE